MAPDTACIPGGMGWIIRVQRTPVVGRRPGLSYRPGRRPGAAESGFAPNIATMSLAEYGTANMALALRGLELKTLDPVSHGWHRRVVPAFGHVPVRAPPQPRRPDRPRQTRR